MRYADYIPGTEHSPAADLPAPGLEGGRPWILRREPDSRWTLRERDERSGDLGQAVRTSGVIGDVIDATFWAGEHIDAEAGRWAPLDDDGTAYGWRPAA